MKDSKILTSGVHTFSKHKVCLLASCLLGQNENSENYNVLFINHSPSGDKIIHVSFPSGHRGFHCENIGTKETVEKAE